MPRTSSAPRVGAVAISSPERLVYPALALTKLDLAHYYERVAAWMMPHVRGRPLSLVRCAQSVTRSDALRSECSFLKHSPEWHRWAHASLRRVAIREQKKVGEYLVANSADALVALVQGGVVEIHGWGSTEQSLERPDQLVFDLDPGPRVTWAEVVKAAKSLRELLRDIGLASWPKLTGGKGVHLVVPISPELTWQSLYAAAAGIARSLAAHQPERFTTDFAKDRRGERILIDYKRNHRTATSIAAFSTRAHPRATVAVPVRWNELKPSLPSDRFDVPGVLARLTRLRSDPWRDFWNCRQRIAGVR